VVQFSVACLNKYPPHLTKRVVATVCQCQHAAPPILCVNQHRWQF